ncbi:MAG TPA: TolC family protein [Bryobacteraceae bacterium]|nr:TolC family protein [Bryobacteraceae bacterium]
MRNRILAAAVLLPVCALGQQPSPPNAPLGATLTVDLANALMRARAYSPQFLAAGLAAETAHQDRVQAKAAFFPSVNALSGYIYTQGNGTPSGVFIANNGVHEYAEEGNIHAELYSPVRRAEYHRAIAAEAAAQARQDIARRGLAITVIQSYYAIVAANRRAANARQALQEAGQFETITQQQENGGEAAHADVVKAQLQQRQRQTELQEAQANIDKAKIGLAVLIFQNLEQPFNVVDDLNADAPLAPAPQIAQQALANNPDLRAAQAAVQQTGFGLQAARGAYYPSVVADYFFGLDSNVVGWQDPNGNRNYGSSLSASLSVPIWNWGITRSRVRQAQLLQQQAQNDLTFAQRTIQANVDEFYIEAQTARAQLDNLRESMNLAADSLRLTLLRYQAGEATALEVVDAQTSDLTARNAYGDGLARYRLALANIETLTGRY